MLTTVGLLLAGGLMVGLCLLYKAHRGRPWLLALVAVAVGLVLLTIPMAGEIADVLAGWLMETLAPYALPILLFGLLCWLAHRWWRRYPGCSPTGRLVVLALTATLGVAVAGLLRIAPYLPDAARVAGEGARAGVQAGVEKALEEAGEEANPNGGGGPTVDLPSVPAVTTGRAAVLARHRAARPATSPPGGERGVPTIRHPSWPPKRPLSLPMPARHRRPVGPASAWLHPG